MTRENIPCDGEKDMEEIIMHVLIITDLEGVNGVLNFPDWCTPAGFRNETGCRFLTEEVNAAVAGFFAAGATQVTVVDAHGSGGSIRDEILDSRAALQRGSGSTPGKKRCDAVAFVGQHAKAGTPNAHLAHTQTPEAVDYRMNGVSLGEFGQIAYEFYNDQQIPTIFAAGDLALTKEARDLVLGIFTTAVKEGFNPPLDSTCPAGEVMPRQSAALHYPRQQVLAGIRRQSELAVQKFLSDPGSFAMKPLAGPYQAEGEYRATSPELIPLVGDWPARRIRTGFHDTVAGAFREFYTLEWAKPEGEHYTLL